MAVGPGRKYSGEIKAYLSATFMAIQSWVLPKNHPMLLEDTQLTNEEDVFINMLLNSRMPSFERNVLPRPYITSQQGDLLGAIHCSHMYSFSADVTFLSVSPSPQHQHR